MHNNVCSRTLSEVTWCVFQNSLFFRNEQRRSNVTMDESSVAEGPDIWSSIISSVAEEASISASMDDEFFEGEETMRIIR